MLCVGPTQFFSSYAATSFSPPTICSIEDDNVTEKYVQEQQHKMTIVGNRLFKLLNFKLLEIEKWKIQNLAVKKGSL